MTRSPRSNPNQWVRLCNTCKVRHDTRIKCTDVRLSPELQAKRLERREQANNRKENK